MSLPLPFSPDRLPSAAREGRVEWSALALGLSLGLAVGLSTVYGHSGAFKERAAEKIKSEQERVVEPLPAGQPILEPVHRRMSSIPVRFAADEKPKSQPAGKVSVATRKKAGSVAVSGNRTLAYWNALNDIIAKEGEMRAPPTSISAANAGTFLTSRTSAAKYAAKGITALDARGVDPELLSHAGDLAGWYRDETKLSERGSFLLEKADVKTRKGTGGNQWKSDEEQHRQKCDELNQRGKLLQEKFAKKYRLEFPPLL